MPTPITLVTGASGFIGSRLVAQLRRERRPLRLTSRDPPSDAEHTREWVCCDLAEDPAWPDLLDGVGTVFWLAGQTSAAQSVREPAASQRINADAIRDLLAATRSLTRPPTVVLASTETIAGVRHRRLDDELGDEPTTPYDVDKRDAEASLAEASARGWVRGTALRLSTVYGPSRRPQAGDRGIIAIMLARALAGQPLTVYGDGELLRDFLYLDDAIAALLAAERRIDALVGDRFLVGAGRSLSLRAAFVELAELVRAELGVIVPVVHVDPPAELPDIDRRSVEIDARRFRARTGWAPRVDFEEGLRRTLRWHVEQRRERPA